MDTPNNINISKLSAELDLRLNSCEAISDASIRTANKVHAVREITFTQFVPLGLCTGVLIRHGLIAADPTLPISVPELDSALHDIYYATQAHGLLTAPQYNVNTAYTLLAQLIHKACGSVRVCDACTLLTVLCGDTLNEIYNALHTLVADHDGCVSRRRLRLLLQPLAAFAEFLQEGDVFGSTSITNALHSCFVHWPSGVGVSKEVFLQWLQQDGSSTILAWLTAMHTTSSVSTISPLMLTPCRPSKGLFKKLRHLLGCVRSSHLTSPFQELMTTITKLEKQHRQLRLKAGQSEYVQRLLEEHRAHLASQIQAFRPAPPQSTPLPRAHGRTTRVSARTLDILSPVVNSTSTPEPPPPATSLRDISSWIGDRHHVTEVACNSSTTNSISKGKPGDDLDALLDRLQSILTSDLNLDESDDGRLRNAAANTEQAIATLIDDIEKNRHIS